LKTSWRKVSVLVVGLTSNDVRVGFIVLKVAHYITFIREETSS